MQYFNNLPIVNINDEQHRNLFKRVVVDYIKENQLINYRIKDFETLPSIANNLYGSAEYWWVIALLNSIYDINFDMPLPTQQIEYIANELATEYKFDNSVIASGATTIARGDLEIEVSFTNDSNTNYFVALMPNMSASDLDNLVNYTVQKLTSTTFKVVISEEMAINASFAYGIFIQPPVTSQVNLNTFSDYFDKLIRESDIRRNIRLIKTQDLSYFVTQFLLAINTINTSDGSSFQYKKTINLLKNEPDYIMPTSGLIVDIDSNNLVGNDNFKELIINKYDYDYHIYICVNATTEQIDDVGDVGVRANYVKPRVYNSGIATSIFDYMIVAPDNKNYSTDGELIQSGIDSFSGTGRSTTINIDDYSSIETSDNLSIMIMPIIDDYRTLSAIGKYSFIATDVDTIKIYNTGEAGNRFFWSAYKRDIQT